MGIRHDKLVRDLIPEVIAANGARFATEVMDEGDYDAALRAKVLEEAAEIAGAGTEDLAGEIADQLEVLAALAAAHGISEEEIGAERERKRIERGGFDRRLRLLWTED
ncbi:nucleoside triphosphate pyrophosphohydrolase [Miltoncostaea oceani]|uniref:nucleoside triphosphate pyrophosphohydrolase n=1 Tax=Miltoncostaea oceani TaxID=2843216 RepID=UPI001C3CD8AD|nr:nucleoside triphosphate pyrophosphohydrolase [Miltoncostaea oceani]